MINQPKNASPPRPTSWSPAVSASSPPAAVAAVAAAAVLAPQPVAGMVAMLVPPRRTMNPMVWHGLTQAKRWFFSSSAQNWILYWFYMIWSDTLGVLTIQHVFCWRVLLFLDILGLKKRMVWIGLSFYRICRSFQWDPEMYRQWSNGFSRVQGEEGRGRRRGRGLAMGKAEGTLRKTWQWDMAHLVWWWKNTRIFLINI